MNAMRYITRVDAVLRCGLKRVDAVRTELEFWQKDFEHDPKSFFAVS
jgi:hypothetical protein